MRKTALSLSLMLAGCAGKHYSVCLSVPNDPTAYCRAGYRKTDARIAAETMDMMPFVERAWPAKTPKNIQKAAPRPPAVHEHGHTL